MRATTAGRNFVTLTLGVALLASCAPGPPAPSDIRFEAIAAAFEGNTGEHSNRVFDLLAADMDTDGDDDLLINWHHLAPLELFENAAGRFRLVNPPADDRSGLYDNRAAGAIFAAPAAMRRRVKALDRPGLAVWHDLDRRGSWRFAWTPDSRRTALLTVETSLEIDQIEGLDPSQIVERTSRTLAIVLDAERPQAFGLATEQVTVGLTLALRSSEGEPMSLYIGRQLEPLSSGEVELWKPDPHGIAWADVEADARPEIYIARGALIGQLEPPRRAKRERYYLPSSDSLYELAADSVMPRDRSRGRRVEWVNVDGDGRVDLSVAAEASPNRVLVRRHDSDVFADRAATLGLDLERGAVQSWGDHDGDGREDVYVLADGGIDIFRNLGEAPFEVLSGSSVGLVLPEAYEATETQFDFSSIRLADFDNDGDLDLWLLSSGDERTNHLFRRDGDHFTDVSREVGLDQISGGLFATLCDFDNDGFEDGLSSGWLASESRDDRLPAEGFAVLWHNREGHSFSFERLPRSAVPQPIHAATCIDANADALVDVAAAGPQRLLLLNRTPSENSWVGILPQDAGRASIGAVVRLTYSDGRIATRRFGSARNSAFSQSLAPLRFGIPAGVRIERLTVRWPGQSAASLYPTLPELERTTTIERSDARP